MKLDTRELEGEETEEIVASLIEHVTKSDEEVEQEREEGTRTTELKAFVAHNSGFNPAKINERIEDWAQNPDQDKNIRKFINNHNFVERQLNDEAYLLEIFTPSHERSDEFILFDRGDYLLVATTERRSWTKKTIERLIRYIEPLERVFLAPADLTDVLTDVENSNISGFTAKRHSYHSDKEISIRFFGGEEKDIKKVEEDFNARPTRLEFNQTNSPEAAVENAINQEGYYTFSRVQEGSEQLGVETFYELFSAFGKQDENNYQVNHAPKKTPVKGGYTIEGYTALKLVEEADLGEEEGNELASKLEEEILDYKRRYEYSTWEPGNYIVFDKEHDEPFEIAIESDDIVIYAKPATTAASLRDFCMEIFKEFNSTYRLVKDDGKIAV